MQKGQRCDSRDTDLSSKPFGHELVSHSETLVDLDCKMKIDSLFFKDICENDFREWGKRQVLISEGEKKKQGCWCEDLLLLADRSESAGSFSRE